MTPQTPDAWFTRFSRCVCWSELAAPSTLWMPSRTSARCCRSSSCSSAVSSSTWSYGPGSASGSPLSISTSSPTVLYDCAGIKLSCTRTIRAGTIR